MSKHEVWGFTIETSPSGKDISPIDLKREGIRRIRKGGRFPSGIAAELGAHECLVRKWWVADRRSRGEHIAVQGPVFAEIRMSLSECRFRAIFFPPCSEKVVVQF